MDTSKGPFDATVSDALRDPITTKLREEYLTLAARESEWSARYGAQHEAVVGLREQMHQIRIAMTQELKQLAETYRSNYQIAKQHEDEIRDQLAKAAEQSQSTNADRAKLRELESASQSYRHLYDSFFRQYTESIEQQTLPISQARVVAPAQAPLHRSHPKARLILPISLFGGIVLGIGIALLRELTDRVFRTSGQVEASLLTPCSALVPLLSDKLVSFLSEQQVADTDRAAVRRNTNNTQLNGARLTANAIIPNKGPYWTLVNSPASRFAESIRSIKLAADAVEMNGQSSKVIGFTSALPNEGKSTIVAAVSELIAQVGYKVIVVDCDLRNPSLTRSFSKKPEAGLIDVITGKRSLNDVIWREPRTKLNFLPASPDCGIPHTSEILGSKSIKTLFDHLRQQYDYIIVDLPPLAPLVDVRATVRFIDSYFLVIEWGRTKVDVVQHALNTAPGIQERLVGAILNKTDLDSLKRYDLHRDKYYVNEDFARYGYTDAE